MWEHPGCGEGEAAAERVAAPVLADRVLGPLTAQRLQVELRVTRDVWFSQHQGAAIRGAFFGVLRDRFCVRRDLPSCQPCTLHAICPISALVATVDDASPRGLDVPRPFTLEPPVYGQRTHYAAGEVYRFGLTLFGRGLQLLPYVLVGLQDLGAEGIGRPGPAGAGVSESAGSAGRPSLLARGVDDEPTNSSAGGKGSAGRMRLVRVEAWNPITRRRQPVYAAPAGTGSGGSGAAPKAQASSVRPMALARESRGEAQATLEAKADGPDSGRAGESGERGAGVDETQHESPTVLQPDGSRRTAFLEETAAASEDPKEDAATIIETYGDLDHNSLPKTVYEKYPVYARKSKLKHNR